MKSLQVSSPDTWSNPAGRVHACCADSSSICKYVHLHKNYKKICTFFNNNIRAGRATIYNIESSDNATTRQCVKASCDDTTVFDQKKLSFVPSSK